MTLKWICFFVAYAKRKKKVRISPDVVTQQIKIEEQKVEEKSQEKDKTSSQKPKSPVEEVKNVEDTDAVPTTNASKPSFNINEFFNEVDYYPPHMVIMWLQNVSVVLMINFFNLKMEGIMFMTYVTNSRI